MIKLLAGALAFVPTLAVLAPASADSTPNSPPSISVSASGTVEFVPDIARLTLGIRVESPSAQDASNNMNQRAQQVIGALRNAGLSQRSIKTTSYNLEYREAPQPQPPMPVPMSASPNASGIAPESIARAALPGRYVASETLQVTAPISLAGKALDAGISGGANESFGLSYQASNADVLYRQALAKAVQSARDSASAIAQAAHVAIAGIQSINTSSPGPMAGAEPFMARAQAAQIVPGTEAISATVYVVYKIR